MERMQLAAHRWRLILFCVGGAVGAILLRDVLKALAVQVAAASALMLLALPVCRQLEKKLPAGVAAALALMILLIGAAAAVVGIVPLAVKQVRQLGESLPILLERAQGVLQKAGVWLESRGLAVSALKEGLFGPVGDAAAALVTRAMGAARSIISGLSKVVLSPLLAFYLLRDRRKIASALTLLLPVACRARGVRAAREMKRETAAFLRGQLLLSLAVGSMTAVGLLLTGTPGWLLLGILMGVLELVPYIGPVLAGVPAVLLALQGGWVRAAWTLGMLVLVQELEGAVLSPRLVGKATALHPMAVLLLVSAGGLIAGAMGMVMMIPVVVSVRGALRGWRE